MARVIKALLERVAYLDYLGDGLQRAENVEEFLNAAEGRGDINLSDFLDLVLLATDEDRGDSGEEKVSLMTIHAAKGLEFPAVFVVGINDDLLPHKRSAETLDGLEEERRLFYVAVTRARQLLYLSYASLGTASGGTYYARRSAFLDDLPPEHAVYESRRKELSRRDSDSYYDPSLEKIACDSSGVGYNLRPGQRVAHPTFGSGIVKKIDGKGEGAVATVGFFSSGTKKILASFFAD